MCFILTGTLQLLCEKSAIEGLLFKRELISLTCVRAEINAEVLDTTTVLEELQPYFTKYAWAATLKKGTVQ